VTYIFRFIDCPRARCVQKEATFAYDNVPLVETLASPEKTPSNMDFRQHIENLPLEDRELLYVAGYVYRGSKTQRSLKANVVPSIL
jgi:hypothetical protein